VSDAASLVQGSTPTLHAHLQLLSQTRWSFFRDAPVPRRAAIPPAAAPLFLFLYDYLKSGALTRMKAANCAVLLGSLLVSLFRIVWPVQYGIVFSLWAAIASWVVTFWLWV